MSTGLNKKAFRPMTILPLFLVLSLVLVVGVATIWIIRGQMPEVDDTPVSKLDLEIAKTALSGCIVAVIGCAISLLVKSREDALASAKLRSEALTEFMHELGSVYRQVKSCRRLLRTKGLTNYFGELPGEFDKEMQMVYLAEMDKLNEAELDLEGLIIEARVLPLFGSNLTEVERCLNTMSEYLKSILDERSEKEPQFAKHSARLGDLTRLLEFTSSAKLSVDGATCGTRASHHFKSSFAGSYAQLLSAIRSSILVI